MLLTNKACAAYGSCWSFCWMVRSEIVRELWFGYKRVAKNYAKCPLYYLSSWKFALGNFKITEITEIPKIFSTVPVGVNIYSFSYLLTFAVTRIRTRGWCTSLSTPSTGLSFTRLRFQPLSSLSPVRLHCLRDHIKGNMRWPQTGPSQPSARACSSSTRCENTSIGS